MPCEFDGANFRAYDGAVVAIDSAWKTLVVSDYKAGSFVIPGVTTVDIYEPSRLFDLGPVNASATHVCGQFKVSQASAYQNAGVIDGAWHLVGGTTPVWVGEHKMEYDSLNIRYQMASSAATSFEWETASYVDVTFEIVSARLRAVVSRYYPPDPEFQLKPALLRNPATVTYHVFCVSFDN